MNDSQTAAVPAFDEGRLAAVGKELAELKERRLEVLAEIGEKALPELKDKEGFADLAASVADIDDRTDDLRRQEEELLEEKARREKEEKERIAKLTCYVCKKVNQEGSRFCEECGAKLGEPPREYCRACCTMNLPQMKFCGECGAKLGDTAAV